MAIKSRPGLQRRSRQVRDTLGRLLLIPRVARLSARTPKNPLVGWNHYWSDINSTGVGGDVLWDSGDLDEIPTGESSVFFYVQDKYDSDYGRNFSFVIR